MLVVYKYDVPFTDYFEIELPINAKILHIAEQEPRCPKMWVLLNPNNITRKRKFRLAGTGHPIDHYTKQLEHITTFLIDGGSLVFHVFEVFDACPRHVN